MSTQGYSAGGVKLWQASLAAVLVWIGMSLGWSWYLVSQAHERLMTTELIERARQVAGALKERMGNGVTGATKLEELEGDTLLEGHVRWERARQPEVAYIVLWDTRGKVVVHTREEWAGQPLPAGQWPPLEVGQEERVTEIKAVPWEAKEGTVLDVTVPLRVGNMRLGYVSVGYSQGWLGKKFWLTQRGLMERTGVFSVVGMGVILAGIFWTQRILRRAQTLQEQSARARTSLLTERGMLASVLAHEVRSPLTALRFNLYTLRGLVAGKSEDTKRKVELTDSCEREIRRLDLMLNDFLQRTQVVSPPEKTSVNQVAHEALDFLRPALERKNVRIVTHMDESEPRVHVNGDELRQVLLNLSANAQEAMPKGGTLVVSTVGEENSVTMLVRDSGVGIPAELQMRIFEPFFTTKPQGSGLGLALVRRVISGAGGTVFCESVEGEGTTFRIVLPRVAEEGVFGEHDIVRVAKAEEEEGNREQEIEEAG